MRKAMQKFLTVLLGPLLGAILIMAPLATTVNVSDIAEVANELHPPMNEVDQELHPDAVKHPSISYDGTGKSRQGDGSSV